MTPKARPLPVWFWGGLEMRVKRQGLEITMRIRISEQQAAALTSAQRDAAFLDISSLISPHLSTFEVIRCNLENPNRGEGRSNFFGTIVICGVISLEEAQTRSWAASLLALRVKIRKYVVEISGVKFNRIRVLRGTSGKK